MRRLDLTGRCPRCRPFVQEFCDPGLSVNPWAHWWKVYSKPDGGAPRFSAGAYGGLRGHRYLALRFSAHVRRSGRAHVFGRCKCLMCVCI